MSEHASSPPTSEVRRRRWHLAIGAVACGAVTLGGIVLLPGYAEHRREQQQLRQERSIAAAGLLREQQSVGASLQKLGGTPLQAPSITDQGCSAERLKPSGHTTVRECIESGSSSYFLAGSHSATGRQALFERISLRLMLDTQREALMPEGVPLHKKPDTAAFGYIKSRLEQQQPVGFTPDSIKTTAGQPLDHSLDLQLLPADSGYRVQVADRVRYPLRQLTYVPREVGDG